MSRQMLTTRVRRGDLTELSREVLAVRAAPRTDRQAAIAAALDVGTLAAVSHRSAAAHWGLPGFRFQPLEITAIRPARGTTTSLAILHTTTNLPRSHLTIVDGITLTIPVRVLFDLAGAVHPGRLERLVDTAWRMHLVTGRLLRRTLAELAEHGRPGIQIMRELIRERGDDYRPTDSGTEGRFQEIVGRAGIDTFERQLDLGAADWIGRVDFKDRELPLLAEIDSERFHTSLLDRDHDARRRAALVEAGFTVLVIDAFDVWHRPDSVAERVREARATLRFHRRTAKSVSPPTRERSLS